jgi:hypothetical protein
MVQTSPAVRRWFIACLLAISLFVISAVAATAAHSHPGVKSDACSICKASETPIIATRAAVAIWPPAAVSELLPVAYAGVALEAQTSNLGSRAPPSL